MHSFSVPSRDINRKKYTVGATWLRNNSKFLSLDVHVFRENMYPVGTARTCKNKCTICHARRGAMRRLARATQINPTNGKLISEQ